MAIDECTFANCYIYYTFRLTVSNASTIGWRHVATEVGRVVISPHPDIGHSCWFGHIKQIRATHIYLAIAWLDYLFVFPKTCLILQVLLELNEVNVFVFKMVMKSLVYQIKVH